MCSCRSCLIHLLTLLLINIRLYDIVSVSAGSLDEFDDFKPTLEQYCIHRADFLVKAKGVEKRYVESIAGEMEKDEASEKEVTAEKGGRRRSIEEPYDA